MILICFALIDIQMFEYQKTCMEINFWGFTYKPQNLRKLIHVKINVGVNSKDFMKRITLIKF